jgi:hypothetical protein
MIRGAKSTLASNSHNFSPSPNNPNPNLDSNTEHIPHEPKYIPAPTSSPSKPESQAGPNYMYPFHQIPPYIRCGTLWLARDSNLELLGVGTTCTIKYASSQTLYPPSPPHPASKI